MTGAIARTGDGTALTVTDPDGTVLARAELTDAGAARLAAALGTAIQYALTGRAITLGLARSG